MSKKHFIVEIREVHVSFRKIEAENVNDALSRAGSEGEEINLEYSHTLDEDTWSVTEYDENDNEVERWDASDVSKIVNSED